MFANKPRPTTNDEDPSGLVRAMREQPDDITLKLIYADWLDETGNWMCSLHAAAIRNRHLPDAHPDPFGDLPTRLSFAARFAARNRP